MAETFTVAKLVKGREPFLRRLVCEVRFEDGQLYLDHTGRLLKKLLRTADWIVAPEPTTKGTTVVHLVHGLQLSFSMNAASLSLDRAHGDEIISAADVDCFIEQAEQSLGFVLDELETTEFSRLGFRQIYYFTFESKEETESWLRQLGLISVSPTLAEGFQADPEAMGASIVMRGETCSFRIALNGIERPAQIPWGESTMNIRASTASKRQREILIEAQKANRKRQINSSFAAELDIDSYRIDPVELELGDFLRDWAKFNLDRFRASLPNDSEKKARK